MRVIGSGNLKLYLRSLDDIKNAILPIIPMQLTTDREPTVLANFVNQRAQLEIKTTEINETFNISVIIVYIKPVSTEYPQQ